MNRNWTVKLQVTLLSALHVFKASSEEVIVMHSDEMKAKFSHSMRADSYPMVYFIIWKMRGFHHQFPIVQENASKSMGRTWEIGTHSFAVVWVLFSH